MKKIAVLLAIVLVVSMPLEVFATPRALTILIVGTVSECDAVVVGHVLQQTPGRSFVRSSGFFAQ